MTRARVNQILDLTYLTPDIQEDLLNLESTTDARPKLKEESLRKIATDPNWNKQRKAWHHVKQPAEIP